MSAQKKRCCSPSVDNSSEQCQQMIISRMLGTESERVQIEGTIQNKSVKSMSDEQVGNVNPYLIFHSPDESEKSPFRKQKRIRKQQLSPNSRMQYMSKMQDFDENTRDNLVFTQRQIEASKKMGMINVTKLQWFRCEKLSYISKHRSFVRVSKCEACNKTFVNHEALGGHKRMCRKSEGDEK